MSEKEMDASSVLQSVSEINKQISKAMKPFLKDLESIQRQYAPILKKMSQWAEEYTNFKEYILSEWAALDEELKTKNRYFPESSFIEIFEEFCVLEYLYSIVSTQEELYRARIYNKQDDTEKGIEFQGYGKAGSDAPPPSYSGIGRGNPNGISYLYTAQDLDTAISEIQPNVGQMVSVAKIKLTEEIKIFDFDRIFENEEYTEDSHEEFQKRARNSVYGVFRFFSIMSEIFSTPSKGDSTNYYATQYISEFIKKKGYDGIRFKSSLNKNGSNIVLFDVSKEGRKYEIISSSLHEIEEVKVKSKNVEESLL